MQKLTLIFLATFLLASCKEDLTSTYLMQHPVELKQAMLRCQSENQKTEQRVTECKVVMFAAANISALIEEQQQDPEKFGQKVLTLQMAVAAPNASQAQLDELETDIAVLGLSRPE